MTRATVEVDGDDWDLDDNPYMGTIRYVQQMQMEMLQENLTEEKMQEMVEETEGDEISEDELMKAMIEDKGMTGIADIMWDQAMMSDIQTICVAADKKLNREDVDDIPAKDFFELKRKAEEVLGGSAKDFFEELGIDTSSMLNENEMDQELASV